ncbi:MAG: hypothetical protein EBZ59_03975 [Planctomycetia bacterium]|nr:hypothetical protein [Planctomycetia bacterium]
MKVLIVSPHAALSPHFETELEIAQQHLDAGDEVAVMSCEGELPGCDLNLTADPKRCHACRTRRRAGWALVGPRVAHGPVCEPIRFPYASTLPRSTADERSLKAWRPFGADLGWGVLSTLISATVDPEPDLHRVRWLMRRLAAAAERVFDAVAARLAGDRIDRVYLFNGRLALERAALRACEQAGVDYDVHERACDTSHYGLSRNAMPHDIDRVDAAIRACWRDAAGDPAREATAARWFVDRANRVERSWHSFTKNQTPRSLPPGWDPSRHNVVVFTSSEDEFAAIGDQWRNPTYANQLEGVQRLVADLPARNPGVHVTIRMHPNQGRLRNRQTDALRAMRGDHVTVIPPEGGVDSYELLRAATVVVTFGSTIGIEAVYWGRPSVLLGPSFYHRLGAAQRVHSHEEAVQAILAPAAAGDRSLALAYGLWSQTHGHRFRYFEPDGLFAGRFKGRAIRAARPRPWQKLRWRVERLSRRLVEGTLDYGGPRS